MRLTPCVALVALVAWALMSLTTAVGGPEAVGGAASAADRPAAPSTEHWGTFFDGVGEEDTQLSPTPVTLPGPVKEVASSNSDQYTLLANGTVYAWGLGRDGQLGDGTTADSLDTPVQVDFPPGVVIADLATDAMPYNTGLAIDTTGHAWGWGANKSGELCLGNVSEYLTPVELPLAEPVTAVAGADGHALYDSGGTVYACGDNHGGDLGDGTIAPSTMPVPVDGLADVDVRTLVASYEDSGALLDDGTYLDWGYDAQGQLGEGTFGADSSIPVVVPLPDGVTQVAQGGSDLDNGQTLVMLTEGSLRSWGDDQWGQLGDGGTTNQASPVPFTPPPGVTYVGLASGGLTSYAVTRTGDVYAWGDGAEGEIGNGATATELTPVMVESGAARVSATAQDVVTTSCEAAEHACY